ncbi:hypothetical protein Asppvi_009305 [Aspergillus pseudoviridinutans]|uniref:Uncharacterized protein n=1 Tax=Aspergillus pseudoviridinutans TaxID=1517512 RepID=A0A9P3BMC0_9EURO|nr:uncharacterized protein Asppvi_009305 [Aspergillus pseudoviridinutans]GIJ90351.1 hypothetical protein Asppvi_009305 [Aspergillus pseudoviridinutans]
MSSPRSGRLPIFFVGETQELPISSQAGETYNAADMVTELIMNGKNIYCVSANDDLPTALAKARITPRVQCTTPDSSILTVYRTERKSEIDYIWLLNNANVTASFVAYFEISRDVLPFSLDAWTGDVRPIAQYSFSRNQMEIPLKLQPHETTIIALRPLAGKRPAYVTKTTGKVEAVGYTVGGKLYASLKGPSMVTVRGTKEQSLNARVPASFSISLWDLEVQDWRGSTNYTSIEPQILVHTFSNQSLVSWKEISPELESVSGIGIYSANFTVPSVKDIGAYLSVGPIFNTLRVWVNGHQLSPFAANNAKVDISHYIRCNKVNNIKVEVSTTLYNRLKADVNSTLLMGYPLSMMSPTYASGESQSYGLQGPVVIDWVANKNLE